MSENEVIGRIKLEISGDRQVIQQLKAASSEQKNLVKAMEDTSRAQAVLRKVQTDIKTIGTNAKTTEKIVAGLDDAIDELGRSKSIISLASHFADVAKSTGNSYKQAKLLFETLKQIGASQDDIKIAAASFNVGVNGKPGSDAQRSVAGVIQRASGAVGLGGVSELSGIIDDVGDFTKAISESGISAGKAALSLGLAGGALAAIAIAVKIFSDNLDKGARVVQQAADSVGVYYKAIQGGTSESIQEQLKAAEAQKKLLDDQITTIENARSKAVSGNDIIGKAAFLAADALGKLPKTDDLQIEAAKAQAEIDGLTRALSSSEVAANNAAEAYRKESEALLASINERASQTLRFRQSINGLEGQSVESLKKRAESLKDEIKATTEYLNTLQSTGEPSEELDKAINQALLDLQILTGTLDNIEKSALPAAKAMESLANATEQAKKTIENNIALGKELIANTGKITTAEKAHAKVLEDRAREESRAAQVAGLTDKIAAAKEIEAQQEKAAKIVSLRKKAGEDEAKAVGEYADDVRKTNRDFMADSLKALKSYQLEESREEESYGVERKRKLRELTADLTQLAAKGDVSAFISRSRSGTNDLADGAEDFSIASRRRLEDFRLENEERIAQRDQRLAELRDEFVQQHAARQANLQAEIQQEQEAGKTRLLQSDILEKQLSDLKAKWAQEDKSRAQQIEDKASADLIKSLTDRNAFISKQVLKSLDPAIQVGNVVIDFVNKLSSAAAGINSARPRIGGPQALANAEGGIYTSPTLLIGGEKPGWGDVMLPFRQSEGIGPAMERMMQQYGGRMGGGSITVHVHNPQFGAIATPADLAAVKQEITSGVVEGVRLARHGGAA